MESNKKRLEILEKVKRGNLTEEQALQEIKDLMLVEGDEGDEFSPAISTADMLLSRVKEDVAHIVSIILRVNKSEIGMHDEMAGHGFDSISYTEFADQVNALYGIDISAAIFFEYTSFGALLNYLVHEYNEAIMRYYRESFTMPEVDVIIPGGQTPLVKKQKQRFNKKRGYFLKRKTHPPVDNSPVAIIGISGIMPQSPNLDIFWEYLREGKNCVTEIPADRWDWREYFGDPMKEPNKTFAKYGGFIPDIDKFDAKFFGISPHEAELMDPQQRILMQTVWNTIEDAGYKPTDFSATKTGVFIGATTSDYNELLTAHHSEVKAHTGTGMFHAMLANRISFLLNLHGPSKPIDTACASSLVAVHRAVESIQAGQCDMAIAGGVNALLTPKLFISFSKAGMLSRDGKCKSFDASADGYVRGEGVGAILLKPLADAERDGDNIYAVIIGSAENHGGRAKSLTTPNPTAQANVIIDAYSKANVDPRTVSFIEAQATGTKIGDPIEILGLKRAFAALYEKWGLEMPDEPYCGIGTVKTNIGHLEIASGMAGIFKVILSMKHQTIPGMRNFNKLNPGIKLNNTPFYVTDSPSEWKALHDENGKLIPRRAGISAFGFGGSNSHLVLEEYICREPVTRPKKKPPYLFILSAKEEKSLKEAARNLFFYMKNYASFDEKTDEHEFLTSASYTLQVGRDSLEARLAIVVQNRDELIEKLEQFTREKKDVPGLSLGFCDMKKIKKKSVLDEQDRRQIVQRALSEKNYDKLIKLWIGGFDITWDMLYENYEVKPRRLSLPGYSFKKTRYWIPEAGDIRSLYSAAWNSSKWQLHPLLMENVSTLSEQRFKSVFFGNEFFLKDHIVFNEKVLPGIASLEMLRAAGELAGENRVACIENVVWMNPVVMTEETIELFVGVYPGAKGTEVEVYSIKGNEYTTHTKGLLSFAKPGDEVADVVTKEVAGKATGKGIGKSTEKTGKSTNTTGKSKGEAGDGEISTSIDIEAIKGRCTGHILDSSCYGLYNAIGLSYGPAFQGLKEISYNENEALARIELPEELAKGLDQYTIHPSIVDSALQGMIGLMHERLAGEKKPLVPFSVNAVRLLATPGRECYAYISLPKNYQPKKNSQAKIPPIFDVCIADVDGNVCIVLERFAFAPLNKKSITPKKHIDPGVTYYAPEWKKTGESGGQREGTGDMLVLDFDTKLSKEVSKLGSKTGIHGIYTVVPNGQVKEMGEDVYEVNIARQKDYAKLLKTLREQESFPRYIIHNLCYDLFIEDAKTLGLQLERGIYSLLYLAQALISEKLKDPVDLYFLFPGTEENPQPQYEGAGGFFKTLAKENPKLRFKSIATGDLSGAGLAKIIKNEIMTGDPDDKEVLYKADERYVKKAAFIDPDDLKLDTFPLKDDGAYIITGGLGGLGLLFAEYIAGACKAGIVLTDLADLTPEREKKLTSIKEKASKVLYVKADMCVQYEVDTLIDKAKKEFGRIRGILHSAGVLRDSFVVKKTKKEFDTVLAPKVYGTICLDEATKKEKLDFILLFSSVSAVIGNVGQGDYAFANGFMDSFARKRNLLVKAGERTGTTIAVNWPLWQSGGMQLDDASASFLYNTTGIIPIATDKGLAAFTQLLKLGLSQVGVFDGDLKRFADQLRIPAPEGVTYESTPDKGQVTPEKTRTVTKRVIKKKKKKRIHSKDLLLKAENTILTICAKILKVNENDIDKESEFADFGLDSILMIKMMNQVEEVFKETVEPNSVTLYPTIETFAQYLLDSGIVKQAGADTQVDEYEEVEEVVEVKVQTGVKTRRRPRFAGNYQPGQSYRKIAVIGMACRFPESPDLESFWNNLKKGRDCISVVPPERWDVDEFYSADKNAPHKSYSKWAGLIDDVDAFDAAFFGISDDDALVLDPQHRILLELTQELIERAGYTKDELDGTKTGVFLGGNESSYVQSHVDLIPDKLMRRFMVNKIQNMMAARISDYYNLKGTSLVIDTACSSALVAIHEACRSIMDGDCDAAITGGVEIIIDPWEHIGFSKSGALSDGPYSFVFDERANGFVLGEGAGLIMLKDYEKAVQDGDQIFGIILGSAVNNDGHTMGLTVPSQDGQTEVIKQAIEASGITPDTISLYEAHGTGTLLGDPIEIKAATQVYREHTDEKQYCAVGSVKSNMGHLLRAAGIVGVIKLLLAMVNKQLPPTLNCERPHPRFKFEESPFYPITEMKEWVPRKGVRRAAISSFGFGGTNGHIILEGFDGESVEYYEQKRRELPLTEFKRKRYWLGEEIEDVYETDEEEVTTEDVQAEEGVEMDEERYRELLVKLQNGEITPEEMMEMEGD